MKEEQLKRFAKKFLDGEIGPDDLVRDILAAQTAELGEATLDLDRRRRCGFPEVVFGDGKSIQQLEAIIERLLESNDDILATRISVDKADAITQRFPAARYNSVGRVLRVHAQRARSSFKNVNPGTYDGPPRPSGPPENAFVESTGSEAHRTDELAVSRDLKSSSKSVGNVTIVTAGTSDLPVAEEARETLDWMGVPVTMIHDVGVAGPHRLPMHLRTLQKADVVVVAAGMEGALPSVVGGYVACPVIAVPTSVGYGASFEGIAALLGMLNSCASNVTVVNIDAGFKAAYVAGLIARRRE